MQACAEDKTESFPGVGSVSPIHFCESNSLLSNKRISKIPALKENFIVWAEHGIGTLEFPIKPFKIGNRYKKFLFAHQRYRQKMITGKLCTDWITGKREWCSPSFIFAQGISEDCFVLRQ